MRPELPRDLPERMSRLPLHRGYPVPWFVAWLDKDGETQDRGQGTPDFRVVAPGAVPEAHRGDRCWICGQTLGRYRSFVIGPMCAVNRTSAEPPSHQDCADWSARACPFLSRPGARRRDHDKPGGLAEPAGIMLARNPGVALVWTTVKYGLKRDPDGGILFGIGDPTDTRWYCEGRPATRDEVWASIESGLPKLQELCHTEAEQRALELALADALPHLPAEQAA